MFREKETTKSKKQGLSTRADAGDRSLGFASTAVNA
jgi:hypothetical protein